METVDWKVEGMTCSNCALSVSKYLEKQGMQQIKVNPISGDVSFETEEKTSLDTIKKGISNLGYEVKDEEHDHLHHGHNHSHKTSGGFLNTNKKRFFFTLPFTAILMLHMVDKWVHIHWLMNPWIQLALCLPVFIVGMRYFGKSAWNSVRSGVPNMDVLITIGSIAAFGYSLAGAILNLGHDYLFFETAASIITLVFMGNMLEEHSIQKTQKQIKDLAKSQKVMANMIAFDGDHNEVIMQVDNAALKTGDLVLIRTGEQVPADCKVLSGEGAVNEAIITGESLPVPKQKNDKIIGGSVLENGVLRAMVTATGKNTVLNGIIKMVQDAQAEKPPMQKLADRISAVFVPLVLGIALLTFLGNYFIGHHTVGASLMRSIAVLVISCPCAMGLATPAAIAVGMGRAAKNGILFRNASALEFFKDIKQVVFDKTGTLTTGSFTISGFEAKTGDEEFKKIAYSLEKYSNHPLAKTIADQWKTNQPVRWKKIEEHKGLGIEATDMDGNIYIAGSYKILPENVTDEGHNIYITKNNDLLGWIDLHDEIRAEAKTVVDWLHSKHIKTILLSGDKQEKVNSVAKLLGIDEAIGEQTPEQKLNRIEELNTHLPTAMIGDGINDAPALAKATLGVSLGEASQLAMQSADVILMKTGLNKLPMALGLGKHTYSTIKQNLFWAFFYNVVAIPIAALGFLTPTFSALAMGMSDVVLALNSGRLYIKKVV